MICQPDLIGAVEIVTKEHDFGLFTKAIIFYDSNGLVLLKTGEEKLNKKVKSTKTVLEADEFICGVSSRTRKQQPSLHYNLQFHI